MITKKRRHRVSQKPNFQPTEKATKINELVETEIPLKEAKDNVPLSHFLKEVKEKKSQDNVIRNKFGQITKQHKVDLERLQKQGRKRKIMSKAMEPEQKIRRGKRFPSAQVNRLDKNL